MNIMIAGMGKIGTTILESLAKEGHDITAIDTDEHVVLELTDLYDVMGVCGNGADYETLAEAGIEKADLFVAVTGSDELNMLSCFLARKMGARHTIARIRNPEYNDQSLTFMKQQLGLSMAINPELLAAQELFNILKLPSALKIETFSGRNFEMIEMRLPPDSALAGLRLSELKDKYNARVLVPAVQRGREVFIPDGSFELKAGDKIGLMAAANDILKLLRTLGIFRRQAKNVMILGGSRTAYYLAKLLCNIGNPPKIIELDPERCHALSRELPKAVIINGDGAQQELLREEGLDSLDAFVALTGMDEENILISIFAASQNVPKVISKVNRAELGAMATNLGLDCIVSPRQTISDIMVSYARALQNSLGSNVETLYQLMDGMVEALEFNVRSDFAYIDVPLKEIRFRKNIIIGGIIRGRKTIIPGGEDRILPGDKVIVIAANRKLRDLSDILLEREGKRYS